MDGCPSGADGKSLPGNLREVHGPLTEHSIGPIAALALEVCPIKERGLVGTTYGELQKAFETKYY